ncbi:hypothetical protein WDW86_11810 [Bdellovibrionota bacterium FG-2]
MVIGSDSMVVSFLKTKPTVDKYTVTMVPCGELRDELPEARDPRKFTGNVKGGVGGAGTSKGKDHSTGAGKAQE